jgi:hypothetical protein
MFPLNKNDPDSIRYRVIVRNLLNPNHPALKISRINKEFRFVNGSDRDPPIFDDIIKTNGNQKRAIARSLENYRLNPNPEEENGGVLRFNNGKRRFAGTTTTASK